MLNLENILSLPVVETIRTSQRDFNNRYQAIKSKLSLEGALLDNKARHNQVRAIVDSVRQGGDEAIARMTTDYDRVELLPAEFRISEDCLKAAHEQMAPPLLEALRESIANVKDYQQRIKVSAPDDWSHDGVRLGLRYNPINRVGICVPGASAPLVSTVIMTVVPAQVAGVKETAIISSPSYNGSIHPDVLGLCYELNVTDVYRVSGAQAVAALAFGTEHIKKVDKIVGPSNWWGQLAKKEVYGLVDIDSFAGPSEVLIIADQSARADFVAADMLSQAEHAPGSALLITDSQDLADEVTAQLGTQLAKLNRSSETREFVEQYSMIIVAKNMDECIELANDFATEHLQIQCENSDEVAGRIVNAGAIFIGGYTPVATGDYYAGPSHTLPTGGSARFFSALNVNDFIKQSSIISYDRDGLSKAADSITTIADAEGLGAHARSVTIRVEKE